MLPRTRGFDVFSAAVQKCASFPLENPDSAFYQLHPVFLQRGIEYRIGDNGINHLENIIRVVKGRAEDFLDESYDLLIANIHYEVIEEILSSKGLERIGWVILSGLMRTQARNLKERMKECGLTLVYEWDYEMVWYTMLARNDRATGRQNVAAID